MQSMPRVNTKSSMKNLLLLSTEPNDTSGSMLAVPCYASSSKDASRRNILPPPCEAAPTLARSPTPPPPRALALGLRAPPGLEAPGQEAGSRAPTVQFLSTTPPRYPLGAQVPAQAAIRPPPGLTLPHEEERRTAELAAAAASSRVPSLPASTGGSKGLPLLSTKAVNGLIFAPRMLDLDSLPLLLGTRGVARQTDGKKEKQRRGMSWTSAAQGR